ncbi:MAG: tetratricopeptide repeat protein [Bdellovibrionaceae bacterium]|nr:tetratricopeptide repeat protein [Pseudobdellovibrionaceae bacterium]
MKIILKFAMFLSYIGSPVLAQAGNEDRYRPILEQASDEYKLGNYKAAAKTFKKVYSKSPELKKPAFDGLIETLRSNKQWDEAIDVLKSEIQTSPFVSDYRIWLSEIYYSAGNYPATLHELAFAEKITGPNESVLKIRYQTQQKLGQHQEAIATITQYLEKQPKSYEALAARSSSYFELNLPGKAYADLQEGYKLRPFDEHIISNLTKVAYVLGRHGDVKIHGQKCMDQFQKIFCATNPLESLPLKSETIPER